jgi:hypothetical protein
MMIAGKKIWELRSRNTAVRGRIALIRKGSKTIVGVADLGGTLAEAIAIRVKGNFAKHQDPDTDIDDDSKRATAWMLEHVQPVKEPVPYRHAPSAVIWVNLDPEAVA